MSVLQSVFGRWSAGIRAAIAFGLPAVIAVAAGFPHQALIIFCGAFAVLYGEGQPYRARAGRVLGAGATILVAVGLGALAGDVVRGTAFADDVASVQLVEVVVLTAVAVFGTYVNDAGQLVHLARSSSFSSVRSASVCRVPTSRRYRSWCAPQSASDPRLSCRWPASFVTPANRSAQRSFVPWN
ncbi:hypothetical protein [Antrihabitans spumae]|uniref:FUSC family protein n=1 Tax=Antrihabitans spumae TaxID=3373370 RepID=A0ABW7KAN6_9NOCA